MHFSSYWFVFVNKLGQGKSGFADNCCKIDGKYGLSAKNNSNEQIIWRLINWRNWFWFGLECYAAVFVQITFMVETGRNWAQQVLFIFCIAGRPRGHKDGQCDARKWPFGRLHNGSIITPPIIRACPPKYAKLTRVWLLLLQMESLTEQLSSQKFHDSLIWDLGKGGIQGTSSTKERPNDCRCWT